MDLPADPLSFLETTLPLFFFFFFFFFFYYICIVMKLLSLIKAGIFSPEMFNNDFVPLFCA